MVPERRETTPRPVSVGKVNVNEAVTKACHVPPLCQQLVAVQARLKGRNYSKMSPRRVLTTWTHKLETFLHDLRHGERQNLGVASVKQ